MFGNFLLNYCWLIDLEVLNKKDNSFYFKTNPILRETFLMNKVMRKEGRFSLARYEEFKAAKSE